MSIIREGNDPNTFDKPIYESNIMENNETERTIDERNEEVISLIGECNSWEELSTIQDSIDERVILTGFWREYSSIQYLIDERVSLLWIKPENRTSLKSLEL